MKIKRSTITRYFCIAPQSCVSAFKSGQGSPLDLFLAPSSGSETWLQFIGGAPQLETVAIGPYPDGQRPIVDSILRQLGIISAQPKDPSVFLRSLSIGIPGSTPQEFVIGIAFSADNNPQFIHGQGPASIQ